MKPLPVVSELASESDDSKTYSSSLSFLGRIEGMGDQTACFCTLSLSLSSFVALGKILNLFISQFPRL